MEEHDEINCTEDGRLLELSIDEIIALYPDEFDAAMKSAHAVYEARLRGEDDTALTEVMRQAHKVLFSLVFAEDSAD